MALWQLFHDAQLPLDHITDSGLVERLGKSREEWFRPHFPVSNANEFFAAMLENTIQYCMRSDLVRK